MSNLTPAASWDAVVQLEGTMSGVPATWNVPNQALLNRTEWLKTWTVQKDAFGGIALNGAAAVGTAGVSTQSAGATANGFSAVVGGFAAVFLGSNNTGATLRGVPSGAVGVGTADSVPLVLGISNVEALRIDPASRSIMSTGGGGLGYGSGSGGTVTQATSKSTAVTLNKPSGQITMSGAALAAGASVSFTLNNSTVTPNDVVMAAVQWGAFTPENYSVRAACGNGTVRITVTNVSAGSLSEALVLNFAIIKGSAT